MRLFDLTTAWRNLPPVIVIFLLADVVLCLGFVGNYLLGQPFSKPTALLDLNGENSLPAWYSSMQFFFIFLLATAYVWNTFRNNPRSIALFGLPAMFLLMSIDEAVQIHEWLGRRSDVFLSGGSRDGTVFQQTGIWMLVLGVPFLILFLLWVRTVKQYVSDSIALRKLVSGIVIMMSGALGCEFLSNFIGETYLVAELVVEEGLEMVGATVMLWSVHDMAREYLPTVKPLPSLPGPQVSAAATVAAGMTISTPFPLAVASLQAENGQRPATEAVPPG